jgi:RNA polymerase sigma-70 factor (ECF subfamily)
MRNTTSDEDILEIFVKTGDELAFRQLAERYSGLIFHTALRTLKNRTLAEDVTQRVLSVLARKASHVAQSGAPLPAWLHRTTLLEAKSVRRSEFRHHRKKEALMNAPTESAHVESSAWQDALPHLDAAIDTLPEADRHVLLLHFVNELTFPEIARRVGKSAAAVQKQSRRALEELQRTLRRRGVTLSIGILTAGLTAEMAKAAPLLLIPALSTLSTLGKTTTSAIVVKKSTLAAVGTTLLLCGIPLARQEAAIRELEARSMKTAESSSPGPTRKRAGTTASMSLPERLARDLKAKDHDVPRYRGAVEYIDELGDESLMALIKETAASSMPTGYRTVVIQTALNSLADRDPETGRCRDPESALNAMMDHLPLEMIAAMRNLLPFYLRSFSERDGTRALAWYQGHLDQIRSIPAMRGGSKEQLEYEVRASLSYGLLFSNPMEAVNILRPLPSQNLINMFDQVVSSVEPSLRKDPVGFIQAVRELLPEKDANEAIAKLYQVQFDYQAGRLGNIDILLGKYEFSLAETEAIIVLGGASHFSMATNSPGEMKKAIAKYKDWLGTQSPQDMDRLMGETLGKTVHFWSNTSEPIYQAMLNYRSFGLNDDAVVAFLNSVGPRFGMEKVEALAGLLSDQETASKIIDRIKSPATE